MTTLAELRSTLRTLLSDNAAEGYLWSDATLKLHINDALRNYSYFFPRERETAVTTVAGQAEYTLPADCVTVIRVCASGPVPNVMVEGDDASGAGYELYGGKLVLLPAPTTGGQAIAVRYLAAHAALGSDTDTSTAPAIDEGLILAFAAAMALQSLVTEEAKRQRFEQRAGQPAGTASTFYLEQYASGLRHRGSRIRSGRLVAP